MKYKFILSAVMLFVVGVLINSAFSAEIMFSRFDHETHEKKAFFPQGITCTACHNFRVDAETKKIVPNKNLENSIFKAPLKSVCHGCHLAEKSKFPKAPQACYNCHSSMENLRVIKPKNHESIAWKQTHSTNARVQGNDCMNCHVKGQCAKCHLRRQDLEFNNHSRNYRFNHSVQARMQPHRCDACHSKKYCVNCHLGD